MGAPPFPHTSSYQTLWWVPPPPPPLRLLGRVAPPLHFTPTASRTLVSIWGGDAQVSTLMR